MTLFSYETPMANLADFEEYQDFHFALSFLCDRPVYRHYLKQTKKNLIIDNSFNELKQPESPKKLASLYKELHADGVVSPDCDGWSLLQVQEAYLDLLNLVSKKDILVVVKTREEFEWALQNEITFCTSYEQRPFLDPQIVKLSNHFLGLVSPQEVVKNRPYSCDTSMPIKLALQGITIPEWMIRGCPHLNTNPQFFDLVLDKRQVKLAKENIEWLQGILNQ